MWRLPTEPSSIGCWCAALVVSSWELLSDFGAVAARCSTRSKTVLLFKHLTEQFPWRNSSVQFRSTRPQRVIPVSYCGSTLLATTRMALRRPRAEGTIGLIHRTEQTEIGSCSKTTPTRRRKQFGPGRILLCIEHTHGPTKSFRLDRIDSFNLPITIGCDGDAQFDTRFPVGGRGGVHCSMQTTIKNQRWKRMKHPRLPFRTSLRTMVVVILILTPPWNMCSSMIRCTNGGKRWSPRLFSTKASGCCCASE